MPSYNLYESLGLDRTRTPGQLDGDLVEKLAGIAQGTSEWNEADTARRILGNPTKRQMYDRRLDDPAQDVGIGDLQQLAAMSVHGWGDQAAATGAKAGLKGKAPGAIKRAYSQYPKATAGVGVLSVLAVVALVGATASMVGGGSDKGAEGAEGTGGEVEAAAGAAEGNQSGNRPAPVHIDPDGPHASAQEYFAGLDFLNEGDRVKVGEVKRYSYDGDRPDEYVYPDGYRYDFTVGNFRSFTGAETPGDPDAPADHPDARPIPGATYGCYDISGTDSTEYFHVESGGTGAVVTGDSSRQGDRRPATPEESEVGTAQSVSSIQSRVLGEMKSISTDQYFYKKARTSQPEIADFGTGSEEGLDLASGDEDRKEKIIVDGKDFKFTSCFTVNSKYSAGDDIAGITVNIGQNNKKRDGDLKADTGSMGWDFYF